MIEWVWRRASSMGVFAALVVAADDPEIVAVVEGFGGKAMLTRPDHSSGTDRVAEVAEWPEFAHFDCIVNLQGDEPFLPDAAVEAAVGEVSKGWDVGTVAVAISDGAELQDPSIVKVVLDERGGAIRFSRTPISKGPAGEVGLQAGDWGLRHVGIYAFSRATLRKVTSLPPHPLERSEALEQLRWLAATISIGVAVVEGGGPGVDTEEDLMRAEAILTGRQEAP